MSGCLHHGKEMGMMTSCSIKVIKIAGKNNFGDQMAQLPLEIDILLRISHENIIRTREVWYDDKKYYVI